MLTAKDTIPCSTGRPSKEKRPRSDAASGNFPDTRGVVKNYLGGVVDVGVAGFAAAGLGAAGLAAAAPAEAGAGTPDWVL